MNSDSNPPTSTPRYLPPHRRSPTYRGHPYLTYDDLHRRYSPPNSPTLHMPRVQRSLSAEDLYHRYREISSQPEETRSQNPPGIPASSPSQEIPGLREETQGQNSAGISALPPPSPPPPKPRDFQALRANRPISPQPVRQPLSPRLPDPPIFTGTNSVPFDDWKMRIQDKLTHNGDHFLTDAFKIAYVVARLEGKASHHMSTRRRYRSYPITDVLLDHLSNIYEVPLSIIRQTHQQGLVEKKAKRFAEQYAKAKAEADAKKGKYSIVTRPNVSDNEDLDIDEAYERGCENWANAQKYGKYSRSDMDIDEAFELSCQGYL
ncbi:hypothetical protein HO173_007070 [Letharia columbiana]|uniref:Uncharacterized protein n=1 Tax=Letharia columbiana TaxID=112416 RepID=A0A8H6FUC0_9LECA|nr:uncharacterized protein HO173_007070 [Letharia columbiana]KAF6234850.1 hypothetical protein HO173_007070 [Letharia columbiana]